MAKLSNRSVALAALTLLFCLTAAAACGSGGTDDADIAGADSANSPAPAAPADINPGATAPEVDLGPVLEPAAMITPDQPGQFLGVAISPDGARLAVASHTDDGPYTLGLYDASTGEQLVTAKTGTPRLGRLYWMADNRLVAASITSDLWLSWDGTTLAELPSFPLGTACWDGRADKQAGAVYSHDGLTSMGENLCRYDSADGSMVRTAEGVLAGGLEFWVVPATGEVKVHRDSEGATELLTLDGATLTPTSALPLEPGERVEAVGETAWIEDFDGNSRTEPGAIPLPRLHVRWASGAGSIFVSNGDNDDIVFVSAVDGTVIGHIPSGPMNLTFSDWSLDDSVFARQHSDTMIEVYKF